LGAVAADGRSKALFQKLVDWATDLERRGLYAGVEAPAPSGDEETDDEDGRPTPHLAIVPSSSGTRTLPLLVMDMYDHAYAIDHGAAAPKYIDAFFQNINWDAVNGRLETAEKAGALIRR
jgi:superoxide dismutase